jgi:ABC-type polysaccharide/polyol phosphate transport system ATPase subunit
MHSDPSNIAISVIGLTKTYRLFDHPGDRIKQFFSLGIKQYHREFPALKSVSFDIKRGETVGIIGRNGSGKSTLLQLICGILKPSAGSVKVNGRISALLELGAGFNPEFTGRENVYFQGALMGFTQTQMAQRFNKIAAFASIGEFIDQPVRTYSSGMFVRLAFAVAVHVEPEILVVDEALAVGDMEFQERSLERMKHLRQQGCTIVLVTHSIPAIRNFCQTAIWLDAGRLQKVDAAALVCLAYQNHLTTHHRPENRTSQPLHSRSQHASGRGKPIFIQQVTMATQLLSVGEPCEIRLRLDRSTNENAPSDFGLGLQIHNEQGQLVTLFNTVRDDVELPADAQQICLRLTQASFIPGRYSVSANLCDREAMFAYDEYEHCVEFEVLAEFNQKGIPRWEGEVACEHVWLW